MTLELHYTPERYEALKAATQDRRSLTLDMGGGETADLVLVAVTRTFTAELGRSRLAIELRENSGPSPRPQDPRP